MHMSCYEIRCGGSYISVRGPGGGNRAYHFRNADGWWDPSERAWFFYRDNGRAVAKAILEVYGEIPEWMERDYFNGKMPAPGEYSDPTVSIALGVVGATIALGVLMSLL